MSSPTLGELSGHTRFVRALARSLLADPHRADDVAQDAMLTAVERGTTGIRRPRAWLAAITRNLVRRQFRTDRRRTRRESLAAKPEATPSAAELAERLDTTAMLVKAVRDLDEPFRETVILRFFDDLTPAEIARRQGVPASTVRGRLSRALATLRTRLDAEHGNDRRAWALALLPLATLRPRPSTTAPLVAAGIVALAVGAALLLSRPESPPRPEPLRADDPAADHSAAAPLPPDGATTAVDPEEDETARRFRIWRADLDHLYGKIEEPAGLRAILTTKGVDWPRVKTEADRRFETLRETALARESPDEMADRAGFYGVLRFVLWQLRDSQTVLRVDRSVWTAWRKTQPVFHPVGLELQPGAFGTILVANVDPRRGEVSPIALRGIGHRATILATVDGVPAAEYFALKATRRLTEEGRESTPGRAFIEALADLVIAEGGTMDLEFHELVGPEEQLRKYLALSTERRAAALAALDFKVTRVTVAASDCLRAHNRRFFRFRQLALPPLTESIDPGIMFGRTKSGYGFLLYQDVSKTSEQALLHALNALSDCPGLIIDLRVNGGGGNGGIEVFDRSRGAWDKPVAVLIGPKAMGAAETEVRDLRALRNAGRCRARFFGRRTAGCSGEKTHFQLPSGFAKGRFISGRWETEGAGIDGLGIAPDRVVDQDVVELYFGIDSCIAAAERWLDAETERADAPK